MRIPILTWLSLQYAGFNHLHFTMTRYHKMIPKNLYATVDNKIHSTLKFWRLSYTIWQRTLTFFPPLLRHHLTADVRNCCHRFRDQMQRSLHGQTVPLDNQKYDVVHLRPLNFLLWHVLQTVNYIFILAQLLCGFVTEVHIRQLREVQREATC